MARTKSNPLKRSVHKKVIHGDTQLTTRKKHRFRPGTVSLREIRKYQKSVDNLVQKATMYRLIREISQQYSTVDLCWKRTALEGVHAIAESYSRSLIDG